MTKEEERIEELRQQWREAAKNDAPNKWDLFKAYSDAKIDYACEVSGFNKTCEDFNKACERLAENNRKMHEMIIDGLEQSAANLNKAVEYSNQTIVVLKEINAK